MLLTTETERVIRGASNKNFQPTPEDWPTGYEELSEFRIRQNNLLTTIESNLSDSERLELEQITWNLQWYGQLQLQYYASGSTVEFDDYLDELFEGYEANLYVSVPVSLQTDWGATVHLADYEDMVQEWMDQVSNPVLRQQIATYLESAGYVGTNYSAAAAAARMVVHEIHSATDSDNTVQAYQAAIQKTAVTYGVSEQYILTVIKYVNEGLDEAIEWNDPNESITPPLYKNFEPVVALIPLKGSSFQFTLTPKMFAQAIEQFPTEVWLDPDFSITPLLDPTNNSVTGYSVVGTDIRQLSIWDELVPNQDLPEETIGARTIVDAIPYFPPQTLYVSLLVVVVALLIVAQRAKRRLRARTT